MAATIGVVGLGYVGMTLGVIAALKKYKVYGIDRNPHIVKCLSESKAHFYEPGLDTAIKKVMNKNFFVVDSFEPEHGIDIFIITVGTPLLSNSTEPNYDYILSAIESLRKAYNGKQLVMLRSTVSVGSTRNLVLPKLQQLASNAQPNEILVSFCPERTIEGKALRELTELPQIVGANNIESAKISEDFFRSITSTVITVESLEALN